MCNTPLVFLFLSSDSTSCSRLEYFSTCVLLIAALSSPRISIPASAERTLSLSCHSGDKVVTLDVSAPSHPLLPHPHYFSETDRCRESCYELPQCWRSEPGQSDSARLQLPCRLIYLQADVPWWRLLGVLAVHQTHTSVQTRTHTR